MKDTWNKCGMCLNSRVIVSENDYHYSCCLSDKSAVNCMIDKDDKYVMNPMRTDRGEVKE